MFARSGVGDRAGVGGGDAGCWVTVGDAAGAAVVGPGDGEGDATDGAAGDGLGEGDTAVSVAVGGGPAGSAVGRGVTGGVGVVAGTAAAVGVKVDTRRGAAARDAAVAVDEPAATVGAGLSDSGGARVGTVTLGVSATSPLQAAIKAIASPRPT